jgi:hypothetical protein
MATQFQQRLHLLQEVTSLVAEAAENCRILHTSNVAMQLAERYPTCGMSVREVEDELIRQIGLSRGVAEFGDATLARPVFGRRPKTSKPRAAAARTASASERACRS